ncbi:MAG: tetratricopeptide repeat protein [Acidobacteriales bacterium]|nr:tetratricopeptide repeat protein [Terriglobales bacterium]
MRSTRPAPAASRYNDWAHMRSALVIVVLSAGMFAQSMPSPCPADRPVDDIIAEIQKQQSKRERRNSNPLPEIICIWGWCTQPRTPPTIPKPAPRADTPAGDDKSSGDTSSSGDSSSSSSTSSSRTTQEKEKCAAAMELTLSAAHNVEVGDFYFEKQNYRAAKLRYTDALEEKPGDAAIHVRLGRALEKLNELPQAIEHYQAAQKLGAPEKWAEEAKSALARLQ